MTSNCKLQGLDMFQSSVFWGFEEDRIQNLCYHAIFPSGVLWADLCEQRHLNINISKTFKDYYFHFLSFLDSRIVKEGTRN